MTDERELREACEHVELLATREMYEAAPSASGSLSVQFGGALVVTIDGVDVAWVNRALGVGVGDPPTERQVAAIVNHLRHRARGGFFFQVYPGEWADDVRSWLTKLGLVRYERSWMKLVREREAPPDATTDLRIAVATTRDEGEDFAEIVTTAFGLPSPVIAMVRALVGRRGWQVHLAYDGDRPVAGGAVYIARDLAWLGFGATRETHRGRGAQSALLASRIRAALDAGCRATCVETGEAVEGKPQISYTNILRAGFRELYARENWVVGR